MTEQSVNKVCKKCQKILPADYKHNYCEACINKHAKVVKDTIKGVGAGILAVGGILAVIINGKSKK